MARNMKDSGIDWLGTIPETWEVVPLKYKVKLNQETLTDSTSPDYEFDYVEIGSVNLIDGIKSYEHMKFADAPSRARRIIKKDDIIVSTVRTYLKAIAKVPNRENLVASTGFAVLTPCNINANYLGYMVKTNYFTETVTSHSVGVSYPAINANDLVAFKILVPPLEEQSKIARFLDERIGEVDTIISKTKASIEDYKKYKQAVITEAITQGLNKSVVVVDTNNVHIPKIPAHWQMKKMKYIFEIKKDIAGKEGYDILSITQKGIKVKDISKNEGQLAQDYSNYQLVDIGDFAMNHMDLLTGWVDISKYVGVTSPDYRVFRFIDATGYDADYYLYLMQMCYMNRIFYGLGQGVSNLGRWRLQADKFLNFTIPEPPLKEQQEIAEYLSARCTEIDALIAKKEAFVEEMEAYKKSLIYEYVTGKKEVL